MSRPSAIIPVAPRTLRELGGHIGRDPRQFFAIGGLRYAEAGGDAIRVRSDGQADGFMQAVPLQRRDGTFRADALATLKRTGIDFDRDIGATVHEAIEQSGVSTSPAGAHQLELLTTQDPLATLREFVARSPGSLRIVRLVSTDRLFRRLLVLDLMEELATGEPVADVLNRRRESAGDQWLSGLVELQPHVLICPPLLARSQPLVTVLLTPFLTTIAMMHSEGQFIREVDFSSWPTGMAALRLTGPGKGVYDAVKAFPDGHAAKRLASCVSGANRLLQRLTAPEYWCDEEGRLNLADRRMAWMSIRIGLDAISSIGADWNHRMAAWEAFRALTVLDGFWGDGLLSRLLNPDDVLAHAVTTFDDASERTWATGIVEKYRQTITATFGPGDSGFLSSRVAEVRNLVHGVRSNKKDRTVRLEVLRAIDRTAPNLQLVQEIATFWWTAVLLSPETHARPGKPPWAQPPPGASRR